MKITALKTTKIIPGKRHDLFRILATHVPRMKEESLVAVTSKLIAVCEGRVVPKAGCAKETLIAQESEYFLPPGKARYGITLTIKNGLLIPAAGIDESNAKGFYVLWPSDPQRDANRIRAYLKKRFSLKRVGVIITDSRTVPLRWGVMGVAVAHSGFRALNDYRGKPDLFGRKLKVTQVNVMDALAASAVLLMGEGKEQTPLALIEDVPFVKFQNRNPTPSEVWNLRISLDEDLYAPLLKKVKWRKGSI